MHACVQRAAHDMQAATKVSAVLEAASHVLCAQFPLSRVFRSQFDARDSTHGLLFSAKGYSSARVQQCVVSQARA